MIMRGLQMQTTVDLPESMYEQGARIAREMGFSLEELIVLALEREIALEPAAPRNAKRISLPLLLSKRPGSLNLSYFDFDDLLT